MADTVATNALGRDRLMPRLYRFGADRLRPAEGLVEAFFRLYGPAKGLLNRLRRRGGPTRMLAWEDLQ